MKCLLKLTALVIAVCFLLTACSLFPFGASPSPSEEAEPSPEVSDSATPPPPSVEPTPTPPESPTPRPTPDNLVLYTGERNYHVFYHFLIAYPELAYSTDYGRNLDTDCVTPTEFRRSLEELYKNNFVLYDLNEYYEVQEDGTVKSKPIMLPEGKKPLIMSFDDICYYEKNLGRGTCDKVIIDDATGKLAMLTKLDDGSEKITYDNDVIPMLEAFCEEFPDFAPFGVKGMLCLTGYDGILGYRTQANSPNREAEVEAVKPIVQKLTDNGWYFSSHGYGHIHEGTASLAKLKDDADKWEAEVAPLLGNPTIHVFPYGDYANAGLFKGELTDPKMKYLLEDKGFKVLCGVGMMPFFKLLKTSVFMDRANIDGVSLRRGTHYEGLMDPKYVYCPEERDNRPITWKP
ncbi:polysaccharide deacetylase family protein [Clostridia bacterium]|nr:polysaccharide deacetylase family protein [Clostridia bacterium]